MTTLIVGASLGGVRAVQALRTRGDRRTIVMVGEEPHLPYDRPPLSKELLLGQRDAEQLRLLRDARIEELGITLKLGCRAVRLDPQSHEVTLADGERIPYRQLMIATGSSPRALPAAEGLAGISALRTLDEATRIRDALSDCRRLLIVGGGFIGAEVASVARSRGIAVTIVEAGGVLMERGLGRVLGAAMTRVHEANGVTVRTGVSVVGFDGHRQVEAVRLSDGSVEQADLVVVGIGCAPRTEWLAGSGIEIADGVVCDERMAARGAADVYALGDVARWHHPRYGEAIRVEHWTNVADHARVIAANLSGVEAVCDALPYFWSTQYGVRLQVLGRVWPRDEVRVVAGDPAVGTFVALSGSEEKGVGAVIARGDVKGFLSFRPMVEKPTAWVAAEALATA